LLVAVLTLNLLRPQLLQLRANKLNAQGVANVLWAYARLAPEFAPPAELLDSLETAAATPSLWADATPQALANAPWAYVRLAGDAAKGCVRSRAPCVWV